MEFHRRPAGAHLAPHQDMLIGFTIYVKAVPPTHPGVYRLTWQSSQLGSRERFKQSVRVEQALIDAGGALKVKLPTAFIEALKAP